ncbi:MAG: DUF349 domain-containing protein [Rudaea sp.]
MKFANLLFKPKWQDKNVDVRRASVASDSDAELIAALPELVRADPESSVRLVALKRLNDYELWRERSTGDADNTLRRTARAAYLTQLCADFPGGPALPRRMAELETLSADELEKVAASATIRELRADALRRIRKPAFLAERALSDPDPALRLEALHAIGDLTLLEKIAERARKTDKIISRSARAMAENLRVDSGDPKVILERARTLCDRLEILMRTAGSRASTQLADIETDWKKLGASIPADVVKRFEGARAVILAPPAKPEEIEAQPPVIESDVATVPVVEADSIASKLRIDAAFAAAQADAQRRRERRDEHIRALNESIVRYESAIDAGDSTNANRIGGEIDSLVTSIPDLPGSMQKALAPLHDRCAELQRWSQWSNNQRRKAICEEIEALPPSLHPDALATRIREFRDEWQRLAQLSQAPEALERRFQGLANRLYKSTRPYFDKRDEMRRTHGDGVTQLLGRAESVADDSAEWKAMAELRAELSTALRSLDRVEPRERTALAKRIKIQLDRFHSRIKAHEEETATAKSKLIARAKSLIDVADPRDITRQARALQTEWTALGNGQRSTDQKLWREFRSACDAAFGKLDTQRKERDEHDASQRTQATTLIDEIESLGSSDTATDKLRNALRDVDTRWQALGFSDRAMDQRYRQGREHVARVISDSARKTRLQRFTHALQKYRLLRDIESGRTTKDQSASQWSELDCARSEFDPLLQTRFDRRPNETISTQADTDAAADLMVRLEFLAGIESPASERQRRMDHQVQRLSSRMRGGESNDAETELDSLLRQWFALDATSRQDFDDRFVNAAKRAIDNLP